MSCVQGQGCRHTGSFENVNARKLGSISVSPYSIRGVTKLRDSIYVLCHKSIRVFEDRAPFVLQKEMEIKEIEDPGEICSSEMSKCLYVLDRKNNCIWKITDSGRKSTCTGSKTHHRVSKWVSEMEWSFTLSVNSAGHLLVLKWSQLGSQLEIYGKQAKLIRSISLSKSIQIPLHAIQEPKGQFIISHKLGDDSKARWFITKLTSDGQEITGQFSLTDRSQKLKDPWHLSLDPKNNRIFVVDYESNRVILLDSTSLSSNKVLLTEENGIEKPKRLFYDRKKRQLIVGEDKGKVDIYEVN